jgi:hypothetical protein
MNTFMYLFLPTALLLFDATRRCCRVNDGPSIVGSGEGALWLALSAKVLLVYVEYDYQSPGEGDARVVHLVVVDSNGTQQHQQHGQGSISANGHTSIWYCSRVLY